MRPSISSSEKYNSSQSITMKVVGANLDHWLLPVLLLIALIFRLYGLSNKSFSADELDQILYGKGTLAFTLLSSTPPLDYLITHFIVHYVGQSEWIVRLPDVLWGVLTVFMVYRLGRDWFDRPVAYLAAFLLAITPLHIEYSQQGRYYSLSTFLFILCVYTCSGALKYPRRRRWLAYGFSCLAALFTHVVAAPFLALLGLWVVIVRRPKRKTLITFIVTTAIPFALFILWFISKRGDYLYSRQTFSLPYSYLFMAAPFFDLLTHIYLYVAQNPYTSLPQITAETMKETLPVIVLMLPLFVSALYIVGRRLGSPDFRLRLSGLLIIAIGGMASGYLIDYVTQYFFDARQFVFYTPFTCLIISASYLFLVQRINTRAIRKLRRGRWIGGSIIVMVALSLLVLWTPLTDVYNVPFQDWRGLAQSLVYSMNNDDVLISPFTEYLGVYQPSLISKAPPGMVEDETGLWSRGYPNMPVDVAAVTKLAQAHSGLWIVLIKGALYQHPPALVSFIAANHLTPIPFDEELQVYRYPQP